MYYVLVLKNFSSNMYDIHLNLKVDIISF
uniref:Uncharacterized protein n=1 Tax=Arundo donax TaxID=35708 RepID=A0A0A9AD45_ARUDO